jgi:molybdopterin-containing oxidoreductase family iron-sulfur binding subunit
MEKCTFCVQRIRYAEGQARDEGRPVADGEIVPACAQTCPAQAIVFGDANDPASRLSRAARAPRGFRALEEVNTQPAITYLARVRRAEEP